MGLVLQDIVPWGRSFDEYQRMFALDAADLGQRILGCGDGPAAFNAALTARGGQVVSVDPLYAFDAVQIHARICSRSARRCVTAAAGWRLSRSITNSSAAASRCC